ADETLLGLPSIRRRRDRGAWLIPVLAVGVLVALGGVLWLALATTGPGNYAYNTPTNVAPAGGPPPAPPAPQPEHTAAAPRATAPDRKDDTPPPPPPPPPPQEGPDVGTVHLVKNVPNFLLQRQSDKDAWQRPRPEAGKVSVNDTLVTLPGSRSLV